MRHTLHTLFRGWRVALLLVVVALLSPQRAAAGCGDHVTVLDPTAQPSRDAAPTADHSAPLPPCSGPNCSRTPEHNAPPPVPTVSSAKQSVPGAGLLDRADPAHAPFDRIDAAGCPVYRPFFVFHPPRAV